METTDLNIASQDFMVMGPKAARAFRECDTCGQEFAVGDRLVYLVTKADDDWLRCNLIHADC